MSDTSTTPRDEICTISDQIGDPDHGEPELDATPQDELAYRLRQQELVAEFGLFALRSADVDDLLHHATRLAAQGMNVDLCKFLEYAADRQDLVVRAGVGWKDGTIGVARLGADFESPAGYAYRTEQPVLSNHLGREDRFRTPKLLADHGVRRALNVPVKDGGPPFGILEVDSTHSGKFTLADISFMQSMANTLAVGLERLEKDRELATLRERETLLAAEMRHRVKNVFSVIGGLIAMTRREVGAEAEAFATLIGGRITALAAATDVGLAAGDDGAHPVQSIDPDTLARRVLQPYGDRVRIEGAPRPVPGDCATPLALVIHELATNAVKYGALSTAGGRLTLRWTDDAGRTGFDWTEQGGPALTASPDQSGFGHQMMDRILRSIGAEITRRWHADGLQVSVRLAAA